MGSKLEDSGEDLQRVEPVVSSAARRLGDLF